ncbi:anthranilate phosphoribosyltransferase [Marinoscillum furvescens]|uniref:Anthranilate phosphoribosyltransferase n=1 Tax=Marinoscillum furvescens DSM 4134 TaxID=1122208 RepID=A0A3D9L314_MARFU|nr:anthranilate phosphoribosyltransferase [Marinoscillum furvescens]RED97458.1 anthranilate phosphoribosyltransferase [Marinoscillum furvescens DSM 4134]
MKEVLNKLFQYQSLSREEAFQILSNLATGQYNNSQMAAFLTVYLMRTITVDELEGFRDAMLELCVKVPVDDYNAIDLCGTGGDGKNTFNISTLSSFVVAGAGQHVVKHGNYGVSSVSGSSNVLESMGAKFTNDTDQIKRSLDESGICFLHAPLFHPAMKNVGPVRKELGIKTFFNMLGPMVNPAFPKSQLVGVFSLELARLYGYLYQNTSKNFVIVHALDGYDEVSLTSGFKIIANDQEAVFEPEDIGLPRLTQEQLHGGETIEESAKIFQGVLKGQGTEAQEAAVIANSGLAIATGKQVSIQEGIEQARTSLKSGKALDAFKKFISVNS